MRPLIVAAALLLGLPLLGVALAGFPLAPFLAFPPIPRSSAHAAFSWPAFFALAVLVAVCIAPFVHRVVTARVAPDERITPLTGLPWWGWLGAGISAIAWLVAWTRFDALSAIQPYTFSPIWLGYVLLVNALTYRRVRRCLLQDRPRELLLLFPLSAAFWWLFEFLNRFVHNWHYLGVPTFEAWPYFLQSTLAFSTVLPAVLSTRDLLATYPRLSAGLAIGWRVPTFAPNVVATATLIASSVSLAAIGVWPELLYPLVWIAPLLVLTSLQRLSGRRTVFAPLAHGDWRGLWQAALAALLCGFFWELWNVRSLAHWEYTVPYVHRFEIFQMPLLGYAGYLPFGIQCLAVAELVERSTDNRHAVEPPACGPDTDDRPAI